MKQVSKKTKKTRSEKESKNISKRFVEVRWDVRSNIKCTATGELV